MPRNCHEPPDVSETLNIVKRLVAAGEVWISEHGYDELASDQISVREVLGGIGHSTVVEDYPGFTKGPKVESRFSQEAEMSGRKRVKFVHEGHYAAEVEVELLEDDTGWSPYLKAEDALKLDAVRDALRREDVGAAAALARVFELRPVAVR